MLSRSCALVFTVCRSEMIDWCRPSRIEVNLRVRGIEHLGGGKDRPSLILETLGEAVDLLEQPARHFPKRLRLAGKDRNRLPRLRADLICGLLDDGRVVGEHLIELRRLLAEGVGGGARVLAEHPVGLGGALAEGAEIDRLQPLGKRYDHGLRPLGHGPVEGRGLLADGALKRLHSLEQRIGERLGPLGQRPSRAMAP